MASSGGVFATLCFLVYFAVASGSLYLTSTPGNFTPGLTHSLTLSCNIHALLPAVSDIFVLQIEKEENGNEAPIASVSGRGAPMIYPGNLQSRITVTGTLDDKTGDGPYLNVTVTDPLEQDKGHYVCVVSGQDNVGKLVKLEDHANVTSTQITLDQVTSVVSNLQGQIDNLLVENNELKQQNTLMTSRFNQLEAELKQEEKENNQSDSSLQKILEELRNNVSSLQAAGCPSVCPSANEIADIKAAHDMFNASIDYLDGLGEYIRSKVDSSLPILKQLNASMMDTVAFIAHTPNETFNGVTTGYLEHIMVFKNDTIASTPGYNTSTGVFTAPKSGMYLLSLNLALKNNSAKVIKANISVNKMNGQTSQSVAETSATAKESGSVTVVYPMTQGDTAFVGITEPATDKTGIIQQLLPNRCIFTGVLIQ